MKAGFSLLILYSTVWTTAAGCAAGAARRAPPVDHATPPVREPHPSVFKEDKAAGIKSDAIDTLSRIIRWHNRRLVALQPRLEMEARELPTPAKPPPPASGRPATPGPGASAAPPPVARRPAEPAAPPRAAPKAAEKIPSRTRRRYAQEQARAKKKRTALYRCRRARRHAKAICRAADKICRLADQLDEQPARERCTWARNQCRVARNRAGEVCRNG